jgi:hypothetical protein
MLLSIITVKTPFLSSLLISLCYKSIKGVSYIRTNIFINRSCFISVFIEVKWFSVIGLVMECFWGCPQLCFSLAGLINSWETSKIGKGAFSLFKLIL